MSVAHTATPYRLQRSENDFAGYFIEAESRVVAETTAYAEGGELTDEERATAGFIVRACNCHDWLVEICGRVRSYIERPHDLDTEEFGRLLDDLNIVIKSTEIGYIDGD